MSKEYKVIHEFLDTVGGTVAPVIRKVGETYPPTDVNVDAKWLDYLEGYRTKDGKPILEVKAGKRKEALEVFNAE